MSLFCCQRDHWNSIFFSICCWHDFWQALVWPVISVSVIKTEISFGFITISKGESYKTVPGVCIYNWRTYKSPSKYNKSRTFGRNNTFFRYKKQRFRPIYKQHPEMRLWTGCSQPVKWPAGARRPAGRIAKAGWRSRGGKALHRMWICLCIMSGSSCQ